MRYLSISFGFKRLIQAVIRFNLTKIISDFLEKPFCLKNLPIVAALLLDTSNQNLWLKNDHFIPFITIFINLGLVCLPLILTHNWASNTRSRVRSSLIWIAGFVVYPLLTHSITISNLEAFSWLILETHSWIIMSIASVGFFISRSISRRASTGIAKFLTLLLSLNGVLVALLIGWALVMAGIFASNVDPMLNQPLEPVISSDKVLDNFGNFLSYFVQFFLLGLLIALVYVTNRYILIGQILTKHGVFMFIIGCLLVILLFTPLLSSAALLLPINNSNWTPSVGSEATLIPSGNSNPFDPINYRIAFIVLAVSTPIILAFEKQKQDKTILAIAKHQTDTELQLLQQQINPHFLFNTLNNVYALTLTKSDQASEMVIKLADLLRYTVYQSQKTKVTLTQELDYIKDYLALQKIRHGEKCHIDFHFPTNTKTWMLPPLLLIILVENAFKHGAEKIMKSSTIRLELSLDKSQLTLICENSIPLPNNCKTKSENPAIKKEQGIGLENLRRRLELVFPNKYALTSSINHDKWCATLRLELEPC